jgi:hypothetical protein
MAEHATGRGLHGPRRWGGRRKRALACRVGRVSVAGAVAIIVAPMGAVPKAVTVPEATTTGAREGSVATVTPAQRTGDLTRPYPIRGAYGKEGFDLKDPLTAKRYGFNVVTVNPYREFLDLLESLNMRAIVWTGRYDNDTCSFETSDSWVATHVRDVAGHPAIVAYYIADEPDPTRCRRAPEQIKERSALVHRNDRSANTYVVVTDWAPMSHRYLDFKYSCDIIGADPYPLTKWDGFHPELIDQTIKALRSQGIKRYWAVIQTFGAGQWKLPNADQISEMFTRWRRSDMEGYFIFTLPAIMPYPKLLRVVEDENHY